MTADLTLTAKLHTHGSRSPVADVERFRVTKQEVSCLLCEDRYGDVFVFEPRLHSSQVLAVQIGDTLTTAQPVQLRHLRWPESTTDVGVDHSGG